MLVDCGTCSVRGLACGECVVTVLWGLPDDELAADRPSVHAGDVATLRLDRDDRAALRALADAGMAPRLRHEEGRRPGRRVAG